MQEKAQREDPYLIQSKVDLKNFRDKVNSGSYQIGYFKQSANIDLSGEAWIPIGADSNMSFRGTYDGGGHEITNLKNNIKYEGGLFGYLSGTVKNLAIINCDVNYSSGYSGAVVASGGTIENCYSTGKVSGKQCGGISGNGSTITNCYSTATVTGSESSYGIGANPSKIDKCVALNNGIGGTSAGRVGSKSLSNNYALKEMKVNNAVVTTGNKADDVNGADLTVGNGKLYKADGTEFAWSGYDKNVWTIPSESGVLPYLKYSSKVALNMGEQKTANITLDTSVQTYTYDKTAKTFALKNVNPSSVTVKVEYRKNGTNDSFSTTAPTNAGSYDVRLTSNGGTDISPYEKVITNGLVIEKAERNFKITSPQDNQTCSYSGKALSDYFSRAVTYDKDNSENIENSIENKIYKVDASSTEQLVGSDFTAVLGAGEYKLVSSVPEIGNYKADSASITFKITKANNQITSFTFPDSWAYGETAKTPTATAAFGTVNFKYSADGGNTWVDEQPTEAGSYKIKAYVEETDNFAGVEQIKDFTITRASNSITSFDFTSGWAYGDTAKTPTATAAFGTVNFKYSADGNTWTDEQPTEAGTYKIKAYVEGTSNYAGAEQVKDFTITQAGNSITGFDFTDGWVYGDTTAKTPTATAAFGAVNFKYSSDGNTWTDTQPTEAGSYKIKAYVDETDNYAGVEQIKDFTITQADNSITSFDFTSGWVYGDTTAKIPTATAAFGTVKFKYSSDGNTWSDAQPTEAGTYKIKAYVEGTSNYAGAEQVKDFTITQATPTVAEVPTASRVRVGRTLSGSILSGGKVLDLNQEVLFGTWAWKDGAEVMNQRGDMIRTVVFIPENPNYCAVEKDISVTVYKKHSSSSDEQNTYTVTFNAGDKNDTITKQIKQNETVAKPKNPEKEGYAFGGWYIDKALTKKYDFDSKVTKDFTLYAKWVKDETTDGKTQIILIVGEKDATVFGEKVTNDVAPVIVNSRTMLPARFVAEALGASVYWNGETRRVTIISTNDEQEDIAILIDIDSDIAYVNGERIHLDSPAFIENGRTYLPIRFICETLGTSVDWIQDELKIIITKK